MQIAKWSESEQKPHDIREFGSVKAPDGLMGDFSAAYQNCREHMTDDDIAAVAALGGGV